MGKNKKQLVVNNDLIREFMTNVNTYLPDFKEPEDLEPEVSEQEDILAEIMAVLPYKGAGGNDEELVDEIVAQPAYVEAIISELSKKALASSGEGQYVWKKSTVVQPRIAISNPSITLPSFGYTPYRSYVEFTANNFDLTKIPDWTSFFNGFKGNDLTLTKSGSSIDARFFNSWNRTFTSLTVNSASSGRFNDSQGENASFAIPDGGTLSYAGDKVIQELKLETVGFVVSSDLDQYPSNSEHTDGYWYELIAQM